MTSIPTPLADRLTLAGAAGLRRLCDRAGGILHSVYHEALLDHQESRGDDAQLYGFKVYKHARFSFMQAIADDPDIHFVEDNGAYYLGIGPVRIRVDSLGHFAHEDVRSAFPDASPTKQDVGRSNALQMRFEFPDMEPPPERSAYSLNALTLGHFGNPREGLVKWYLGAWTQLDKGGRTWSWIERQDDAIEKPEALPARAPIVPFDQRPADQVSVQPRRSA